MMVLRKSSVEPVIGTLAHNNQIQLLWEYVVFLRSCAKTTKARTSTFIKEQRRSINLSAFVC